MTASAMTGTPTATASNPFDLDTYIRDEEDTDEAHLAKLDRLARCIKHTNTFRTRRQLVELRLLLIDPPTRHRIVRNIRDISTILSSRPDVWTEALELFCPTRTQPWSTLEVMCVQRNAGFGLHRAELMVIGLIDFVFSIEPARNGEKVMLRPWVNSCDLLAQARLRESGGKFAVLSWSDLTVEGAVTLAYFHACVKDLRRSASFGESSTSMPWSMYRDSVPVYRAKSLHDWALMDEGNEEAFLTKLMRQAKEAETSSQSSRSSDSGSSIEDLSRELFIETLDNEQRLLHEDAEIDMVLEQEIDRCRSSTRSKIRQQQQDIEREQKTAAILQILRIETAVRDENALFAQFAKEEPGDHFSHELKPYWLARQQLKHDTNRDLWTKGRNFHQLEEEKRAWKDLARIMLHDEKAALYVRMEPHEYRHRLIEESWGFEFLVQNPKYAPTKDMKAGFVAEKQRREANAKEATLRKVLPDAKIQPISDSSGSPEGTWDTYVPSGSPLTDVDFSECIKVPTPEERRLAKAKADDLKAQIAMQVAAREASASPERRSA